MVRSHAKYEQSRAEQSRAEQSRAEQSRAEQSRAEQSRAEQSRAEQSRAEQSRAEQDYSRDRRPLNCLFFVFFCHQGTKSEGILGFGSSYDDACGELNDCMTLLSLQVAMLMVMKPLPKLCTDVILP